MRRRLAGRVIVVDPDECVLLVRAGHAGRTVWFTPGGGTDAGETPREAARRELAEETGMELALDDPPVLHRRARFTFLGKRIEQVETFWFAALDDRPEVVSHHLEDYESAAIDGWVWSPRTALDPLVARGALFPACLPELLDHLLDPDTAPDDGSLPWLEEHLDDGPTPPRSADAETDLPDWVVVS